MPGAIWGSTRLSRRPLKETEAGGGSESVVALDVRHADKPICCALTRAGTQLGQCSLHAVSRR